MLGCKIKIPLFVGAATLLFAASCALGARIRKFSSASVADETQRVPRRKLVVHIGPHKTGTTYFQSRLAAQGGLSPSLTYPETCGRPTRAKGFGTMAHAYYASGEDVTPEADDRCPGANNLTLDGRDCGPLSGEFRKGFFATGSDIIISAEAFSFLRRGEFTKLREDFSAGFDIHILVSRADSRYLLLSHYQNREKAQAVVSEFYTQVWKEADMIDELPPCRFTSAECVKMLSEVFGRERVHVVSYEGLKGAGISLVDFACNTFANDPRRCFREGSDRGRVASNASPNHLAFSASTIFNRLALASECPGRMAPSASAMVQPFIRILEGAGVTQLCRPLRRFPEADCNECFRLAARSSTFPAKAYYFADKYARVLEAKLNTPVCDFEELTLYDPPERFAEIFQSVKYAACAGTGSFVPAPNWTNSTNEDLELLHSLFTRRNRATGARAMVGYHGDSGSTGIQSTAMELGHSHDI